MVSTLWKKTCILFLNICFLHVVSPFVDVVFSNFIVLLFLRDHKTVPFFICLISEMWSQILYACTLDTCSELCEHKTNERINYQCTCKDGVWAFCRGPHCDHKTETGMGQVVWVDGQIAWIDEGRVRQCCSDNHFSRFERCFVSLKWPYISWCLLVLGEALK